MPPLLACQVDSLQLHPRGRCGRASSRSAEARARGLGHGALSSFLSLTPRGQHVVIVDGVMLAGHVQIHFLTVTRASSLLLKVVPSRAGQLCLLGSYSRCRAGVCFPVAFPSTPDPQVCSAQAPQPCPTRSASLSPVTYPSCPLGDTPLPPQCQGRSMSSLASSPSFWPHRLSTRQTPTPPQALPTGCC